MSDKEKRLKNVPNEDLVQTAKKEEQKLLALLLTNKDCLSAVMSSTIKGNYFWNDNNAYLFSVMKLYYSKYFAILTRSAMESIVDSQEEYTEEQKSARKMYWDSTYNINISLEDYKLLKQNLVKRHSQRQAYNIFSLYADQIVSSTSKQEDLVKQIQSDMLQIEGVNEDDFTTSLNASLGFEKSMEYITKRMENPDDGNSFFCGIRGIDRVIYGFSPPLYVVLTGYVNGGKTTLMMNMAFNIAKSAKNVVYISMEKEIVPFYTRLLCMHALVDYNRTKRGGKKENGLSEHVYEILQKAKNDIINEIKPRLHCIQAANGTPLTKLLSMVDKIRSTQKVDALFVDYLQTIKFETNHPTRPDLDLGIVSSRLQAYGKINNLVTFTALQLKSTSAKNLRDKSKKVVSHNDALAAIEINPEDYSGAQTVIADADTALSAVLKGNKMYVFFTKGRDSESRRLATLDFDGKTGKISDPEFIQGQMQSVDEIMYDEETTEEKIQQQGELFPQTTKTTTSTPTTTTSTITEKPKKMEKKDGEIQSNVVKKGGPEVSKDDGFQLSNVLKDTIKKSIEKGEHKLEEKPEEDDEFARMLNFERQ